MMNSKEYNKLYCPVSGSLINPGEKPDFIFVKELRTQRIFVVNFIDVVGLALVIS